MRFAFYATLNMIIYSDDAFKQGVIPVTVPERVSPIDIHDDQLQDDGKNNVDIIENENELNDEGTYSSSCESKKYLIYSGTFWLN